MTPRPRRQSTEGNQARPPERVGPTPVLRSVDSGGVDSITRDTTERKLAEEEVRRGAQLYSRLVNSLDCIVWEADARTFQFSFVSPQAKRMLGYAPEEWLAPGFWARHLHPEDIEWCTKFCMQATEEGRDHEFEYRMIAADGRTVWLHDVVGVQTAPGGPTQLTGVMIDITSRKLAEAARQESEERFRTIFENAGLGTSLVDRHGHPIKCNPSVQKMLGYTESELGNMAFTEFTHPDDIDLDWKLYSELVAGKRDKYEIEKRYIRKNGELMWGHLTVSLIKNRDGTPAEYTVGMIEDITERKRSEELLRESEERFRTIFENAGLGAALVDGEGHPVKCNPALQKMLGYTESELGNMAFPEFTHPDDIDLDWKLYSELLAGKRDKYEIEKRYIRKNGELMWGQLTVSQVKNRDGTPAKYSVGVVEDISDRKRAELNLRVAHDQLTRELAERTRAEAEIVRLSERLITAQEEERTRIARELHDDLSQQIAGLGIALSNIRRQIPADQREARDQAERAYHKLLTIGEGIRHLSHELHPAIIEHSGLVSALESYCTEFELLTKVSATVQAQGQFEDLSAKTQLGIYRIAQEALYNIWRHADVKEAEICLARVEERIHLQISDRGVGFDPSQPSKEAGLGLVSMRERARLLGGSFSIESSPGEGTTIAADIPINSAPYADARRRPGKPGDRKL